MFLANNAPYPYKQLLKATWNTVIEQTNWTPVSTASPEVVIFDKTVLSTKKMKISSETGISMMPQIYSDLSLEMYEDSETKISWKQTSQFNVYPADQFIIVQNWEVFTSGPFSS